MPDNLYWDDALLWSEQQAARLRRLAAGERVNDVDWEHVIDEIEDVGKRELRACSTDLRNAITNLLKLQKWPAHVRGSEWRSDIFSFLADAKLAFGTSMRERIDMNEVYFEAVWIVHEVKKSELRGKAFGDCPFILDEQLGERINIETLLAKLPKLPERTGASK